MKYKYTTYVEWGLDRDENGRLQPYENCFINKVKSNDSCIQFDGDNYVSKGGSEGMEFTVHNSLKEAIIRSHFDIGAIKFTNISVKEITSVIIEILKEGNTQYNKDSEVSVVTTAIINEPPEEEVN